jgi:ubiquinone/menaquinone biosynthesis C-methylase UbiE
MIDYETREKNKNYWNDAADHWFGTTALPTYGVRFVMEDDLHLFDGMAGKTMLEIGCGSGHSLVWQAQHGAGELWGLDISEKQLANARRWLSENQVEATLVCSPMEESCGIPENHFDVVYSIYAIGWTTDLLHTFRCIACYLKQGGRLIFSWKHPIPFAAAEDEDGRMVFHRSCFDTSYVVLDPDRDGNIVYLRPYQLSDYINALAQAGFAVKRLVEQTDSHTLNARENLTSQMRQAQTFPLSFLIEAQKL